MAFGSIGGLEWPRSRGRGVRMRHAPVVTRAAAACLPPHEKRAYDSGTAASTAAASPPEAFSLAAIFRWRRHSYLLTQNKLEALFKRKHGARGAFRMWQGMRLGSRVLAHQPV